MRRINILDLMPILKDVALMLFASATGVWAWFKTRHAYSWPSAQRTIMGARVHSSKDSYIRPWVAELSYTYVVNGEYYSGFHRLRARSERRAEEKIEGWKARMVVVRYSPDQHDLSALLKADQPGGQLGN